MGSLRLVTKYTGMAQNQVLSMNHDYFLLNLKYAFIDEKMETEEGREYLKKAYRLQQVEPDYVKLKDMNGYQTE